jgi:hypothetical protein
MMQTFKTWFYGLSLAAGLLAFAGWMDGATPAAACETPRYYYKTVFVYQPQEVSYVSWETKRDHCGKPCQAPVIRTRTVNVPVKRVIRVAY